MLGARVWLFFLVFFPSPVSSLNSRLQDTCRSLRLSTFSFLINGSTIWICCSKSKTHTARTDIPFRHFPSPPQILKTVARRKRFIGSPICQSARLLFVTLISGDSPFIASSRRPLRPRRLLFVLPLLFGTTSTTSTTCRFDNAICHNFVCPRL